MTALRVGWVAAVAAVSLVLATAPASAATWTIVASPNPGSADSVLFGVDADSPSSAWAVGYADASSSPWRRPMIQRWDGTGWSAVATPALSDYAILYAVDASTAASAWAVGAVGSQALIERWDGSAWTVLPGPTPPGATNTELREVKAVTADDAWAVGTAFVPGASPSTRTLITRWNGAAWTAVPSPNPDPTRNLLVAVDSIAPDDAWAVGNIGDDGYGGGTVAGLVLHWNGSSWSRVTIPTGGGFSIIELRDVVALAGNDVWVVGTAFSWSAFSFVPYVLHWNGQSWQHGSIPAPPAGGFHGVTALSATKVYAAGQKNSGQTLVARWNGATWMTESTPNPSGSSGLYDAAAAGPGTVWAVGDRTSNYNRRTLTLRATDG
jgi:hypothetical protein